MKCRICGAENLPNARFCSSCGSNMDARAGADLVVNRTGPVDNAGDSRWKVGAGAAGAGLLVAAARLKFLPFLLFKLWWVFGLVRLTSAGGVGAFVGGMALLIIAATSIFRFRRHRFL